MDNQINYKNVISEIPSNAVEIYRMLPEGTRCEVIFNELIMSPSPSREHQYLIIRLTTLLFQFLESNGSGILLTAPFDLYFDKELSITQPDLFVVLKEEENIIREHGVYGTPAVIIEILSTNRLNDTKRKKVLYEKAGVREYFIIDPKDKQTVLLTLNNEGFYKQTYAETGIIKSAILNCSLTF